MIQRIQTLYLLGAAGILSSQFSLPYASAAPNFTSKLLSDGKFNLFDNVGLSGLTALGILLALVGTFLYKNRRAQNQLATLGMIVCTLLGALVAFNIKTVIDESAASGGPQWGLGLATPVLSILLFWLANRGIRSDIDLLRRSERLRD